MDINDLHTHMLEKGQTGILPSFVREIKAEIKINN
jgi:hypothetical protein